MHFSWLDFRLGSKWYLWGPYSDNMTKQFGDFDYLKWINMIQGQKKRSQTIWPWWMLIQALQLIQKLSTCYMFLMLVMNFITLTGMLATLAMKSISWSTLSHPSSVTNVREISNCFSLQVWFDIIFFVWGREWIKMHQSFLWFVIL